MDHSSNRLGGTIPLRLGDIAHLKFLLPSGNQLSGTIPPKLGNMGQLARAHLRDNQLSGCLLARWQSLRQHNSDIFNIGPSYCEVRQAAGGSDLSGDGAALAALYHATGGESRIFSYDWLSKSPSGSGTALPQRKMATSSA